MRAAVFAVGLLLAGCGVDGVAQSCAGVSGSVGCYVCDFDGGGR